VSRQADAGASPNGDEFVEEKIHESDELLELSAEATFGIIVGEM